MEGYLATVELGIIPFPESRKFKSIFCKHMRTVQGEHCAKNGMLRISGRDVYLVCTDCGKILDEAHTTY